MVYKKFVPNTLISSSEINSNSLILTNDITASARMWVIGEDLFDPANCDLTTPFAQINYGETTDFKILHSYQPNSISVYVDGIRMKRTTDFTETGDTTIHLVVALVSTQDIIVDYIRKDI
jgi:hypothetical protein